MSDEAFHKAQKAYDNRLPDSYEDTWEDRLTDLDYSILTCLRGIKEKVSEKDFLKFMEYMKEEELTIVKKETP